MYQLRKNLTDNVTIYGRGREIFQITQVIQDRTLNWVVKYAWKGRGISYRVLAEDLKNNRPLGI
jgi:hypothetical protein